MEALPILVKNMETKKDIRKRILKKRSELSHEEWQEKSRLIAQQVVSHSYFLEADEIYCYVDYNNEAGTHTIIEHGWKLGKKVAVPKIHNGKMDFYYIQSYDELEEGFCHVLEPVTEEIAKGVNVLVVMPGSVFDQNHGRLGYGKGFYDTYLSCHPEYHTFALAFQLQIVEYVPTELHDIRPQIMITEERIYD